VRLSIVVAAVLRPSDVGEGCVLGFAALHTDTGAVVAVESENGGAPAQDREEQEEGDGRSE
jgi:hypothetical protein